jgi:hypothetical protein
MNWPTIRLGEVASIKHGFAFKRAQMSEANDGDPIVVATGNFSYTGGFRFDDTRTRTYSGDYRSEYCLSPGDTLMQTSPHENLQLELLRKLLNDEIRAQSRRNLIQSRKFSEMLEQTLNRYRNRSLSTAEVILELIEMARTMRDAPKRGDKLGLDEDELAFYDALADHGNARDVMGDEVLSKIAHELVEIIRNSVTIDWTQKDTVQARMRTRIKRLLRKHGYPPDQREVAVLTVLTQAEHLCRDWAEAA